MITGPSNMLRLGALIGLALLSVLGGRPVWSGPDDVAVVIGNRYYQHPDVPEVLYAHNDALAIRRWLLDEMGYEERNVITVLDATQARLTSLFGNARSHEGQLWQTYREGRSSITVFYSGHGMPGLNDDANYILPIDVDPATAHLNGFPLDLLYGNLEKLETPSVLVLMDACFSGFSHSGALLHNFSGLAVKPRPTPPPPKLTVLAATEPDQIASWDEEAEHGLFTAYFLKALAGEADNVAYAGDGDGIVTLTETAAFLDDEMRYQAKRRFGRRQSPVLKGDGSLVMAKLPPLAPEPEIVVEPPVEERQAVEPVVELPPTPVVEDEIEVAAVAERPDEPAEAPTPPRPGVVGSVFRDCPECPEMVVVPAGTATIGSPRSEPRRAVEEGPQIDTAIEAAFAVGRYEVTFDEWEACQEAGGCNYTPGDAGMGRGARPVINVSFNDAQLYVDWLSDRTGQSYALLSEAEWELSARAGTAHAYPWGDRVGSGQAVCDGCGTAYDFNESAPVGSFDANALGLHDMAGNVWEWVSDCWRDRHSSAIAAGQPVTSGDCRLRVLKGGSYSSRPHRLRSAAREAAFADTIAANRGFRVKRVLEDSRPDTISSRDGDIARP